MGVYNPFAEFPNSCALCDSREKCDLHREYAGRSVGRHPDCPLVEVETPHGRLADVSEEATYDARYDHFDDRNMIVAQLMLDDLPTIIKAEGKDDG